MLLGVTEGHQQHRLSAKGLEANPLQLSSCFFFSRYAGKGEATRERERERERERDERGTCIISIKSD